MNKKNPTLIETIAAIFWAANMFIGIILYLVLLYFKKTRILALIYTLWIIYDNLVNKTPSKGRKIEFVRKLSIWNKVRDYFPITLHKTENLDSNKQYLFGYHPHGIVSISANILFASEALSISKVFKGIDIKLATIPINFWVPFWRDYILCAGYCDCDRKAVTNIFKNTNKSVTIVIGGANESLLSHPGTYKIILKRRTGFIRIALKNGVSLVPVMNFGEVDLFEQITNKHLLKYVKFVKNTFGFNIPMFYGRFRLWIPFSTPINIVTGKPIDCPKIENPTNEDIQKYLNLYIAGLQEVWEQNKDKYAKNRKTELILVE